MAQAGRKKQAPLSAAGASDQEISSHLWVHQTKGPPGISEPQDVWGQVGGSAQPTLWSTDKPVCREPQRPRWR